MVVRTLFTRAYLTLLGVFMVVMFFFGFMIYQNTARTMKAQLGEKCIGIATSVAVLLAEDIDGFVEFTETLDVNSEYYTTIRPKLMQIRNDNRHSIAFLYVEMRISENEIMYILDSEHEDDPLFSVPGVTDDITTSERAAYEKLSPFTPSDFVTNQYGTLLTCYAPLRDPATGETLALVGVDVSIDQYSDVMRNQFVTILLSVVLLVLMLMLTLSLSSGRLEKMVARDNLTGAYNKAHFLRSLRQQLKYSDHRKKEGIVAVFMADLDHFKSVNDTYGHVFGDIVLSTVSQTMSKQLRKVDCLARYGGEEFSAFLPDTDLESAARVIERVRKAVENLSIPNRELGIDVKITISLGLAVHEPNQSVQELLELADKALYKAKRTRNATAVYNKDEL